MGKRIFWRMFIFCGLFLSACGWVQPPMAAVTPPACIQEPQIVTQEVTRIVRETHMITAVVTRIVRVEGINPPGKPPAEPVPTILPEYLIATPVVVPAPVGTIPPRPTESPYNVAPAAAMTVPRAHHTATRLLDDSILIVGGSSGTYDFLADVDLFYPTSGAISRAAPLHTPRHAHTATLLPDGRVLVVGGYNPSMQWLNDAEVYDPFANTWTVVSPLFSHGVEHSATLLQDGRVLVVGGAVGSGVITARAEIFDPQTDSWSEVRSLEFPRASHTAQLLDDGRVLVAGGGGPTGQPTGGDALLYNPGTNQWSVTGGMAQPRIMAKSVRLSDGRVLVAGGMSLKDAAQTGAARKVSSSAEIYDPDTNTWRAVGNLAQPRYYPVMEMLPDGRVLVSGGANIWECCFTSSSFVREVEVFDPGTGLWSTVGKLALPGAYMASASLSDGRVWVTGGVGGPSGVIFRSNTWLITVMPVWQ